MAVETERGTYFVAVRFTAVGDTTPRTGVWLATSLDGTGPFFGVDGVAKEVTDWPDSATRGVPNGAAAEQRQAVECLG